MPTNTNTVTNTHLTETSASTVGRDPLGSAVVESPVGPLTVVASTRGVRAVLWPVDGEADRTKLPDDVVDDPADDAIRANLADAAHQLEEYFEGSRTEFDVPLDPVGTEFQLDAWRALRTIAYGESVSYGEQAERLGDRNKARAVGAANGKNPISIIVPCHRVVGSNGSLTGFAGGVEIKRWLLAHEARISGQTLDV